MPDDAKPVKGSPSASTMRLWVSGADALEARVRISRAGVTWAVGSSTNWVAVGPGEHVVQRSARCDPEALQNPSHQVCGPIDL